MDEAIKNIALQVPVTIAGMGIVTYGFLQVIRLILDTYGKKMDRLAEAWEAHNRSHNRG